MRLTPSTLLSATATSGANNEIVKEVISGSTGLGIVWIFYHFVYPKLSNMVEDVYNNYYDTKNSYLRTVKRLASDCHKKATTATVDFCIIASCLLGFAIALIVFSVCFYDANGNTTWLDWISKYGTLLVCAAFFFLSSILFIGVSITKLRIHLYERKIGEEKSASYRINGEGKRKEVTYDF